MWRFKKAADNSAQYILSLEGTRLQKELGELYVPLIHQQSFNISSTPLSITQKCYITNG